jgi:PhnB protein
LTFYGNVFGCAVQLHTFAEFNRAGGPADAMAHGYLTGGHRGVWRRRVRDEPPFRSEGMMLALLGTAASSALRTWFSRVCGEAQRAGSRQ